MGVKYTRLPEDNVALELQDDRLFALGRRSQFKGMVRWRVGSATLGGADERFGHDND